MFDVKGIKEVEINFLRTTLKLLKVDSLIYNFTKILKIDKCCRYWSHMHDFT